MGLLSTPPARMPTRTSYPGSTSLSGRRDKRTEASSSWSVKRLALPLTLLIITGVAVTGIFKVEYLAAHITNISRPVLHHAASRGSSHTATSPLSTTSSSSGGARPPSDVSNPAAEPKQSVISMSASLMDDDEDDSDDSIHPPAFESLGLGSAAATQGHAAGGQPSGGLSGSQAAEFKTLSLGSPNSQQQQQQLNLARPSAAARPVVAVARWSAKPPVSQAPNKRNRLMLATHSRLMWYYPDTDDYQILHEGEGVHYGMFPGAGSPLSSVWTAIRPHNWRPSSNREFLVELDMETGAELQRVQIPSRFTHDVVRADDSVFVCDTGNGRILQLSFPDMKPVRSMDLFSLRDHPNTLAPLGPDNFLVVLHNLGNSDVVRVNVSAIPPITNPDAWLAQQYSLLTNSAGADAAEDTPQIPITKPSQPEGQGNAILGRVQHVGQKAHGLVPWQGAYVMLDSDNGALVALDLTGTATGEGFKLVQLWKAPEAGIFLKGLTVVDDVAYFGISPWAPRSARDDPKTNNQLAAFDLISGQLLWRREVPTAGLLNIVGAPHLAEGSTYLPSYTGKRESDAVRKHHTSPEVAVAMRSLNELGYPPVVGGYWSSGLPYLDTAIKGTKRPWEAGLQLPLLMLNITDLQAAVAALPAEAWTYDFQAKHSAVMAGREGNQAAFKPGVEGIVLLFSANDGSGPVFKFPAYDYFAPVLEPLLEEVLGKRDMRHIIRLQLALMKPGVSDIKIHVDSGGYAIKGHRLHIPVFTHPDVSFDVCPHRYVPDETHVPAPGEPQRLLDIQECFKIPTVEGFVFELNNRAAHKVSNLSPVERVHIVFDLCEEPHPRVDVPVGTVCDYDMEKGLLCKYPNGAEAVMVAEQGTESVSAAANNAAGSQYAAAADAAGMSSGEAAAAAASAVDDGQDGWETDDIMMPVEPVDPSDLSNVAASAAAVAGSTTGAAGLTVQPTAAVTGSGSGGEVKELNLEDADEALGLALAPAALYEQPAPAADAGSAGREDEDEVGSEGYEQSIREPVPAQFQQQLQLGLMGGDAAAGGVDQPYFTAGQFVGAAEDHGLYDEDDRDGEGLKGVMMGPGGGGSQSLLEQADMLMQQQLGASGAARRAIGGAVGGFGSGLASVRRLQAAAENQQQQ